MIRTLSGGKLMAYSAYSTRLGGGFDGEQTGEELFARLFARSGLRFVATIPALVHHLRERGRVAGLVEEHRLADVFGTQIQHCVRWRERTDDLRADHNVTFAGEGQAFLEQTAVRMARLAHAETGYSQLCLAGGTLLNTAAVRRILDQTPITEVFVQPAANDAGAAIGAAFHGFYADGRSVGERRPDRSYSTYLGKRYSPSEISAALHQFSGEIAWRRVGYEQQIACIVDQLVASRVVAVFRGRSEFGPRALGNRSLLAAPGDAAMLHTMNRIKRREWYRPVAPVLPEEVLDEYFVAPFAESPFMTINATCRATTRELAPAICHVDGSARVQTVRVDTNGFLHELLWAYARASGKPPILINTSFNVREPIVESPNDALRTFTSARVDLGFLLLEDHAVTRL